MRLKSFLQRLKAIFFTDLWTDWFVQWLHGLPLPYWLTCTVIGLISVIILLWSVSGQLPPLSLLADFSLMFTFPYGLYMLWHLGNNQQSLIGYLNSLRQQNLIIKKQNSLNDFFKFVSGLLRISFVLVALFILIEVIVKPSPYAFTSNLGAIFLLTETMFSFNIVFLSILKIQKLLSIIYNLRSQDIHVNLLDLSLLYKLSETTQRTAIYLPPLSALFWLSIISSYIIGGTFDFSFITGVIIAFAPLLLAAFIFVAPIFWIRNKIIESKRNNLAELGQRLQIVFQDQDRYAEQEDFEKVAKLKDYAEALISRRVYIQNVSDWPWETRVFREFSVALFIPIIIWIIQFYLTRWLGK